MAPIASPKASEEPGTPSTDNCHERFYPDDLVYKFDKRRQIAFGTVQDPEAESEDDSSDTEALTSNQVMVTWNNSTEKKICARSKVHLLSRNIAVGDCVTRLEDGKETQKGVCKEIEQVATVQVVGLSKVVERVARNRLVSISQLTVDEAVALGDKFGRIMAVDRLLKMKSKCGATVEIRTSLNNEVLEDHWNEFLNAEEFPFYPDQIVVCCPNSLQDANWTNKFKFKKRQLNSNQKFTIESVEICSIEVSWNDGEYEEVQGDDIKKLVVLPWLHNLAIGDRFMMQLKLSDVTTEKREWSKSPMILADRATGSNRSSSSGDAREDNSCEAENENETDASWRPVEVLCADCKATVVWQDGTEEKNIPSTQLHYVSDALDAHEFFPGGWVVPNHQDDVEKWGVVQKVNFAERIAEVKWFTSEGNGFKEICTSEHSVYDLRRDPEYKFELGSIVAKSTPAGALLGKVNDVSPQGFLVVEWLDGSIENCRHKDNIELVPENDSDDDYDDDSDSDSEGDDDISWETASFSGSEKMTILPTTGRTNRESVDSVKCDDVVDDAMPITSEDKAEPLDAKPLVTSSEHEVFCVIDEAPVTHQYYFNNFEPKNMQKFGVALQREYKLLKGSLPAGIWVRTYDNRTDLLSVMIRGVEKTPYEDGLFLFDIQLPADYPKNPPQVHFISYIAEQLNPNLYVEGVVCVSLLGTWDGQGSEVWTADSTLLQLIVSIQGLILVAEPHYNEAGYEKQTHTQQGKENSRTYNEFVLLKMVQSMTKLLEDRPQVFHSEVMSHFRKNGETMCQRIEGYCSDNPPDPGFPLLPVSKGLKLSLAVALQKFRETLAQAC